MKSLLKVLGIVGAGFVGGMAIGLGLGALGLDPKICGMVALAPILTACSYAMSTPAGKDVREKSIFELFRS